MIRVYQDSIPWEGRDKATLLALGMVLGNNYFIHPLSDLATGIPADTSVVLITSNGFNLETASAENDPSAQANLDTFVHAGGTLIVDMADYLDYYSIAGAGFMAPGATGIPTQIQPYPCSDATLAAAAFGEDGIPGTLDDHAIIMGPDGVPGTGDDLNDSNIGTEYPYCDVAVGNLIEGITLPGDATILMTATFDGVQKPILAEYKYGDGKIILDTLTKEYYGHKPVGTGPSYFLINLLHYALQLPALIPPANDEFENATVVTEPLPFVDEINTFSARSESNDPVDCFGISPTVWYQFTPTQNTRFVANTLGSYYDTTVSVYTGSHGSLTSIACGFQSSGGFDAVAGNTYYFGIGAYYGLGGGLSLLSI